MIIEGIEIRPSVLKFAREMELKLQENDHKGGWQNEGMEYLFDRLEEEVEELGDLLGHEFEQSDNDIKNEAVDIANFAMMIFDNKS